MIVSAVEGIIPVPPLPLPTTAGRHRIDGFARTLSFVCADHRIDFEMPRAFFSCGCVEFVG